MSLTNLFINSTLVVALICLHCVVMVATINFPVQNSETVLHLQRATNALRFSVLIKITLFFLTWGSGLFLAEPTM